MTHEARDASDSASPRLLRRLRVSTLVTTACVATLLALVLMSWSVLDPTPLPVMVAMSVGQVVGTAALGCYLLAILLFQLRQRRARRTGGDAPSDEP